MADGCGSAFEVLATNAITTVPELTRLMLDNKELRAAQRALHAIAGIETSGLPTLISVIEHTNYPFPPMAVGAVRDAY